VLVLGPLAIPLVWRTPAWGPRGRWIATVLILAYTVLLCWQVWVAVQIALEQMQGLKL
jgi:predicted negative regulator of RcsB-dependent stress response